MTFAGPIIVCTWSDHVLKRGPGGGKAKTWTNSAIHHLLRIPVKRMLEAPLAHTFLTWPGGAEWEWYRDVIGKTLKSSVLIS